LPEADLLSAVSASGFENVEIVKKHNIFEDVPNPSSALEYGTQGVSLRARKPQWMTAGLSHFFKVVK
jgi:hypothetical protein